MCSSAAGPGGAASKQPNQVRSDTEEKPSRSTSLKSRAFHTYGENTTGEEQTAGAATAAAASSSSSFFFYLEHLCLGEVPYYRSALFNM